LAPVKLLSAASGKAGGNGCLFLVVMAWTGSLNSRPSKFRGRYSKAEWRHAMAHDHDIFVWIDLLGGAWLAARFIEVAGILRK